MMMFLFALATNSTTGAGVYDMNGKIGMLNTASGIRFICLAINTTGFSNIQVSYTAATQRQQNWTPHWRHRLAVSHRH
jgi:hypothetical protein